MRSPRFRLIAVALLATGLAAVPARAAITTCSMGGPTPGYKAIRLDLPTGTDFVSIEPKGTRVSRVASDSSNWHLAQGIVIFNAQTLEVEAFRVEAQGSGARAVVLPGVGAVPVSGPDGPFYHTAYRPRAGLPAGTYYAVGFGSDGGPTLPNEWWAVDIRIGGAVSCASAGVGEVFDVDNTEFTGGTQAYAIAAGMAEGIEYELTTSREVVVGFMDAGIQGPGEATLDYSMPGGLEGTIEDEIVPFVSQGGTHAFTGNYQGIYPVLLVAGVAVDLV